MVFAVVGVCCTAWQKDGVIEELSQACVRVYCLLWHGCVTCWISTMVSVASIASIVRLQVNFLALDFDLTIVDIHTSGRWPGTPEQLVQRIRPFFQALIPVAVAQGEQHRKIYAYRNQRCMDRVLVDIRGMFSASLWALKVFICRWCITSVHIYNTYLVQH